MVAKKTVSDSIAPKKPATAAAVRAAGKKAELEKAAATPVAEDVLTYEDLSPELQAIFDEAEAIKEKEDAERRKRNATITAFILARFKIVKESGENADLIKQKFEALAELESESAENLSFSDVADPMYAVVEAIVGKPMAKDFLQTVGGDKIAFVQIMKDVIRLGGVAKR